jgi:hypothetical protein
MPAQLRIDYLPGNLVGWAAEHGSGISMNNNESRCKGSELNTKRILVSSGNPFCYLLQEHKFTETSTSYVLRV